MSEALVCELCGGKDDLKQLAERLSDGRLRTSLRFTCVPCVAANPDHKPEMGEPFPFKTYGEMMTAPGSGP